MAETALPERLEAPVHQVLELVRDELLPALDSPSRAGEFGFRLRPSAACGARVLEPVAGRYRIQVDTGLVVALDELLGATATREDPIARAWHDTIVRAVGDEDVAHTLRFVAGIVFVLLHEVFHALGGHVAWNRDRVRTAERTGPGRGDRSSRASVEPMSTRSRFLAFAELEADGAAYDATLAFTPELAAAVGAPAAPDEMPAAAVESAVIAGAIGAIGLLQGRWHAHGPDGSAHPFPDLRVLNVCSAHFRATVRGLAIDSRAAAPHVAADDERLGPVLERYRDTILPAIFALDRLLAARYALAPYLEPGGADAADPTTPLARDIARVLGGGEPGHTAVGRELVAFVADRGAFVEALAPYRRIHAW